MQRKSRKEPTLDFAEADIPGPSYHSSSTNVSWFIYFRFVIKCNIYQNNADYDCQLIHSMQRKSKKEPTFDLAMDIDASLHPSSTNVSVVFRFDSLSTVYFAIRYCS